ncbi:hypothetical protein BOX15_Mlig003386g4 [Macrostomum lignano]|uniref:Uncharacterized protein n=1 Tax=Macrostomum lignano TaxID=282301 RepID=A0A267DB82_9PLAT|nr:hypothetical protein BOX15_Mlig003386g4 [Macrostomum lignano]
MTTKLQHHLVHPHHQHDKTDSNIASFGGTVTTTLSAAEGSGLRSVEKNAVLTEQLGGNQQHLLLHSVGSDAASGTSTGGTGDSGSVDDDALSAASGVSSGVSTDSAEMLERRLLLQRQQLLLQQQQQLQQQLQQQHQHQQQSERFASLLTVERGPATWTSHAQVNFRYRSDRLYYLDSASRLHGPMDQREQCQVASVRRYVSRSSSSQPPVATRSHHRTMHTVQTAAAGPPASGAAAATSSGFVSSATGGLDDGILLLERRLTSQSQHQHQHHQLPYSRVQVNRYDDWNSGPAPMPRSYSQQLDYGAGFRRQRSHRDQPVHQQHHSYHRQHQQFRGRQHSNPGFDARLEHLERSLNDAMESIRRQTSVQQQQQTRQSHHHQHHQHHGGRPQNQQHLYIASEHQDSAELNRRFSSEPPFEFRYSQRTMTHEPPQVTEEVETTTLQPIGRGIHDLGSGSRVIATQVQQQQQQYSLTEQRGTVGRVSRLAVRPPEAGARSLSANRNATLRASTPVSPKPLTVGGSGGGGGGGFSRGRHLSATPSSSGSSRRSTDLA